MFYESHMYDRFIHNQISSLISVYIYMFINDIYVELNCMY